MIGKICEDGNRLNDTKTFHIDLPVYLEGEESEDNYEYKQIVDTLAFLGDIRFRNELEWTIASEKKKTNHKINGIKYEGTERVRQKILKI